MMAKTYPKHRPSKPGRAGRGHCGACAHARRDLIDVGLVCATPRSVLAKRFDLSEWTLTRHSQNHLPPTARAAIMTALAPEDIDLEQLQRSESESLLASLIAQRARLATMAQSAMEHDLPSVAIQAERAVLANLETVSRLLGMLVNKTEITTRSILLTPQYLALRRILVEELRGSPEIAARIAARIGALESDAAMEIAAKGKQPVMIEARPA
jgi:hypothetical protein